MKCPNCGSEASETAIFCTNCGASLTQARKESGETAMLYCRKCGAKLPEGATYCTDCGTPVRPVGLKTVVELAGWGERFIAWLIDIIIIGAILSPIKWFLIWPSFIWAPSFLRWIPFVNFGLDNVIYFLYWTIMEGTIRQSIGKMVMKMKVTQLNGVSTDIVHAAIESLGKAFLLPIDCILGWIFYPTKNQRLFNYISETIIVKTSR